ncbi:hypothetical protein [Niastella sp. OAS944]|uniref:hypothetical protein n=1 Tax=Niastella sp. OAS944 TaxID=2664089 RepID=UPI003483D630|nr:hypothetical protein [Chitinophagaceae bacterium OAS944]
MKKLFTLLLLLTVCYVHAQKKVFKAVSEDISSQFKPIYQDYALVGYVAFTQLEKISTDSFSYKITIMDENLNDIGVVNLRDHKLILHGARMEQDVLSLCYLKSNFYNNEFANRQEYIDAINNDRTSVFFQFLNLNGKIINTASLPVTLYHKVVPRNARIKDFYVDGGLKGPIQFLNVTGKGFAAFYRDDEKNSLVTLNTRGDIIWQKQIKEEAFALTLLTAGLDVYVLGYKAGNMLHRGYELYGYNASDPSISSTLRMNHDDQGNRYHFSNFSVDPATGKAYISGYTVTDKKYLSYDDPDDFKNGSYAGLFTINIKDHVKGITTDVFSNWVDGSQSFITKDGHFKDETIFKHSNSFKDYNNATYHIGTAILINGSKVTQKNTIIFKQDDKGNLTIDNSVEGDNTPSFKTGDEGLSANLKKYYTVTNPDTKTFYLIIDDKQNIYIYNLNTKKVVRTISHIDGNITTQVFPAKEGHVIVAEYNKKEKTTTVSIEAI